MRQTFIQKAKRLTIYTTTEQINKIISRASRKNALIFSILRDTGLGPMETHDLTLKNIDLERGAITIKSTKFGNSRVLKLNFQH